MPEDLRGRAPPASRLLVLRAPGIRGCGVPEYLSFSEEEHHQPVGCWYSGRPGSAAVVFLSL
jgi:hypothetical protein